MHMTGHMTDHVTTSQLHYSDLQHSCNFRLQQYQPYKPIKLQNSLNSVPWLVHTVDALLTGCCKNAVNFCNYILQYGSEQTGSAAHQLTDQRPGIVVWSNTTQVVWVFELTVCFETGHEEAHTRKTDRYTDPSWNKLFFDSSKLPRDQATTSGMQ